MTGVDIVRHEQLRLIKYLVGEWGYNGTQAPAVAGKLLNLEPTIRAAFLEWQQTGIFPKKPYINGFTPNRLSTLVHIKPPAIFLLLDWIRREPQEAILAMQEELIVE